MPYALTGKSVIVTGAARGVGLAISRKFAEAGAKVMMADLDEDRLDEEVKPLAEDSEDVRAFHCDLCERLSVQNLVAATIDAFDRVDILVNASRQVIAADPLSSDSEAFDSLIQQNVKNTLQMSQAVAKRMIQQTKDRTEPGPAGSIVNVTSIAARRTLPDLLAYSVSCAALDQLTRSLAVALACHSIRVNAVALGGVMTSNLREALRDREGLRDELTAVTPLGRIGEADEAADAAVFLASAAASFVTGQILAVDGGRTMLDPLDTPAH
ncbi:MAG: SDR family oxidoreductase [Pseudomonadota bacterium]